MDKILFIDGLNSIFRASVNFGSPTKHFEIENNLCICKSPWNTKDNFCYGEKYYIVFNFFRNLRPIVELFQPNKIFFVLEGRPQFRYDLYPEYKANRIIKTASKQESIDKFYDCTNIILKLLKYLPITIAKANVYECDDVIGALCEDLKDENLIVLSNDSDYIQLLQRQYKSIKIYNPIKKEYMQAPNYPYVAWKSLAGDKSDNISAITKSKNALLFMEKPNLLKSFLDIEENRCNFNINKKLIEFFPVPLEEIIFDEGNSNFIELKQEFEFMKFNSITNEKSWIKYTKTFDCISF